MIKIKEREEMKEQYKKSLVALKQYDRKPNVKEWTNIARNYNFIGTKTMCYLSGISNWSELCDYIRRK